LESQRREAQLHDYLETKFIRDYRIPKVGRGRLATLLSYGIETAADVDERHLYELPGFGPTIIAGIVAWRDDVARGFRFDPSKPAPAGQAQAIVMKYRQLRQSYETRLRRGCDDLLAISEGTRRELAEMGGAIQRLVVEVRQADADASVV
jgi:DNA-binding helix-hairpin-helix protein with protein kinase domain